MGYPHFSNDCDEYHCLVRCFHGPDNTETSTFIGAFAGETGEKHVHRRPTIVCLCGSTKFADAFIEANARLTMQGEIVLSVGRFGHLDGLDMDGADKAMLDNLHKRKIDLADYVYVLNVGGYIGDSTRSEIEYAQRAGKSVRYLETS